MPERMTTFGPIAAVAGAVGLCCGLPLLLSLGVLGAVAGLSLQSWALIGLGLLLALVGGARWARHGRRPVPTTEVTAKEHQA
ncbi:hypothetical protein [Nocardioides donggukensis]|uniref:Mercury transporter n=1 Tax=Nocardioides donggukensis TaxID=2774019 RepID=A0A927K7Y6_9ACTN|nr:hypothetical protein [Nocardioides donggukensis]MBD8869320.1 hypothetical protein [Nocardioides donggukensis]